MARFDPPFAVKNLDELAVTLANPRQARWVTSEQSWYVYDYSSDATADQKSVVSSITQPGRWIKKSDYAPYSI